jgi:hypothetical protein
MPGRRQLAVDLRLGELRADLGPHQLARAELDPQDPGRGP